MTNQVLSDDALKELEKLIASGVLLLPLRVEHWHQSLTDGGWFIKCDTDRILATVRFVPAEIESGRPALDGNAPSRAIVALLNSIPALIATVKALKDLVYLPKILPDDEEVTYQEDNGRLLRDKVDLQSQLEALKEENERLKGSQDANN